MTAAVFSGIAVVLIAAAVVVFVVRLVRKKK